jgi:molybdopterin/thiamine biosynthesis adenylyltransferase
MSTDNAIYIREGFMQKPTTVRFTPKAWRALLAHHRHGLACEHLSIAFARVLETDSTITVIVDETDILLFGKEHCSRMHAMGVALSRKELRKVMWAFAQSGRRAFVTMHDHWFSASGTGFSGQDDRDNLQQDQYLRTCFEPALRDNPAWGTPRDVLHVSIVFDRSTLDARVVDSRRSNAFTPVRLVTCAEQSWQRITPNSALVRSKGSALHARHKDFLSSACIQALSHMRVGILGCGGLGPMLAENLARMGVGHLVLVDADTLDESNLNRWLGSKVLDVGRAKATLLAEKISTALPATHCTALVENALDGNVSDQLAECDVLFGALDCDGARQFLNRLALQFVVPYFDVSVRVQTKPSMDFLSRFVPVIAGHTACMECAPGDLLDHKKIEQVLSPIRELRAQAGYVADADIKAPSVMALNMRAASDAILEFLGYLNAWSKLQGVDARAAGTQLSLSRWRNSMRVATDPSAYVPNDKCVCVSELATMHEHVLPKRRSIADYKAALDLALDEIASDSRNLAYELARESELTNIVSHSQPITQKTEILD